MIAALTRVALASLLAWPAAAFAARSAWSEAERAQVRLLASQPKLGRISGGIEILLEPGWHTYWRTPGETGVPPIFDFSGSDNIASVEVLYPAPERYDDGASVSLIYRDEVVFPLSITPLRSGEPVTLRLHASFGVCREICIPTEASSELPLPQTAQPDALSDARLKLYQPRVPRASEPGRFDLVDVEVEADGLLIDVLLPESSRADLFAEGPPGWNLSQPTLVSRTDSLARFRLALAGMPPGSEVQGQQFRFVAVAGGEAIEEVVTIR